ncbi:MAG TPA: glycosyltransferase [Elusimicrobiota bacterium]|nr:glycosyltransferase [Elusimicrobiota bacterium]
MRVALVHDWLTGMRGGEKVFEVLCGIFPEADVFTLVHIPGKVSPAIERHPIKTSFIQKLPLAFSRYRHYLPLMPLAAERFDLSGYDMVVSSSHCVAKGVRVPEGVPHVCYCHTPMRYLWDQYEEYFGAGRASAPVRAAMRLLRPRLQRWDVDTARGVSRFIANSRNVAGRIRRHYGREAEVIHPPVDTQRFRTSDRDDGYYLVVSALVPYKRVDVAVEAFTLSGKPLKIVGSGPEERSLRAAAGRNIEFLGWADDEKLADAYAGCRALIFPGEEDFGIVPLEAMASGKPVLALGKGGALETVRPLTEGELSPTGLFFDELSAATLNNTVDFFESARRRFHADAIRRHAETFDVELFRQKIQNYLMTAANEAGGPRR